MIRAGQLCWRCNGVCKDEGVDGDTIVECPACNGEGCSECDGGGFELNGCPNKFCREVVTAVNLVDLFHKGLPPVAGGALDQSVWFVEAAGILEHEEALIKAESHGN